MKKTFAVFVVILALVAFTTVSFAADIQIEKKIENIVFKKDKNGSEFARIVVADTGTLNGISYKKTSSVMAFSDMTPTVRGLKKGQTLKAIVSEQNFRGTPSYLLLKVLR
ncbi:MAG: hypothetical protein CSYNP_01608 [Syntrophus sp. SKADARSKE-3]|nr:hypothetical protein [Syntrophus sp. SKADARSKE-3]